MNRTELIIETLIDSCATIVGNETEKALLKIGDPEFVKETIDFNKVITSLAVNGLLLNLQKWGAIDFSKIPLEEFLIPSDRYIKPKTKGD